MLEYWIINEGFSPLDGVTFLSFIFICILDIIDINVLLENKPSSGTLIIKILES